MMYDLLHVLFQCFRKKNYILDELRRAPHYKKVFYAWECKGEVFPHILYAISAEVHFNIIHYFVHVDVMRTHHVFSRGREDVKEKELNSLTKELVAYL